MATFLVWEFSWLQSKILDYNTNYYLPVLLHVSFDDDLFPRSQRCWKIQEECSILLASFNPFGFRLCVACVRKDGMLFVTSVYLR